MKIPWLVPLLLSGGAVPTLGAVEIAGDKVLSAESQVLLGKGMSTPEGVWIVKTAKIDQKHAGIPFQEQARPGNPRSRDGASIHSASANLSPNANGNNNNNNNKNNTTKPTLNIQQRDVPRHSSQHHQDSVPIITVRTPPAGSDQDPDPDPPAASTSGTLKGAEERNPASANRAIAGMGAGLVSVMLVFVVFL